MSSSVSFSTLRAPLVRTPCDTEKSLFNSRCPVRVTKFLGTRLRSSGKCLGSERLHVWKSEGPLRRPKLRVVVRAGMSTVPKKPLGLYDPAMDKDSCGVGFVAELSGEGNRKTVSATFPFACEFRHDLMLVFSVIQRDFCFF